MARRRSSGTRPPSRAPARQPPLDQCRPRSRRRDDQHRACRARSGATKRGTSASVGRGSGDDDAEQSRRGRARSRPRCGRPCARRCAGRWQGRGRCRRTCASTPLSACSNSWKMRACCVGGDADAGVAHRERDLAGAGAGLDDDADAAGLGELDGVAGEVEQHLAQPRGVADDALGQPLVDVGGDLEALGLRARRQQLDHVLDQRGERRTARAASSSLPASILEKSRISSISDSSASPDVLVALT